MARLVPANPFFPSLYQTFPQKSIFYNIAARNIYIYAMAIPINSIPALKGKEALWIFPLPLLAHI
jgi:hypothetical protein